jgi:DNA-binding NarL/FixJ family response regulator
MTTPYRQLTQGQRYQIEGGLAAGKSQARIAKQLGVHPATIVVRFSAIAVRSATKLFLRPCKVMPVELMRASTASL